ncbi:MAG: efflux RND transporter permease subunit [Myxococcota bacterium]
MKIAELAVKNPQFTLVVFALLAALGVNTFATIPRSEDPQFPIPGFVVVAVYPGGAPLDVEELVANPIEEKLHELDDIRKLQTKIGENVSVTTIEFQQDADADTKEQEVRRQVDAARAELPKDLASLDVIRFATSNVSLIQVALTSDGAPWRAIEDQAEALEERLEAVPGIKEAKVHGLPEREARVALDVEKLASLDLPLDNVLQALSSEAITIPGGNVDVAGRRLGIKTSGTFRSLEDVRGVVVGGDGQGVVRLGDVADVTFDVAPHDVQTRFDGRRAVFVTATQKDGQNVFAIQGRVAAVLDAFEQTLPQGMHLERGFDQADNVHLRLDRLYEDFAFAILLVLITLLPLGWRAGLIVMIAIPLSLAIGLTLLNLAGFNLNQLSIVGFVIALGLLVDDSIVVVENITRFLREGKTRKEAAILATRQIAVAVVGCTATLVFAFVPLLFLPGGPGDFIRSLPMAVVMTIIASLLVSLTIVPFMASLALPRSSAEHGNTLLRLLNRAIEAGYRPILRFALRHKLLTLGAAAGLVAASFLLVPQIGFSLFPKAGTRQFIVSIEAAEGASRESTDAEVRRVEGLLLAAPEVKWVMANVGKGNPQAYYNLPQRQESSSYGELLAELRDFDPKTSPAFYDRLRAEVANRPNARIEVKEFENGPPIDAPVAVRLLGDDLAALTEAAARVEALMRQTPGTIDVVNPYRSRRTDLVASVDRAKAGMVGVPTGWVARGVRMAVAGLQVGTLREPSGEAIPLTVTLPGDRASLGALDHLRIPTVTGKTVALSDVATLDFESSPTSIQHYGAKQRAVTVRANVATGENRDRVTQAVLAELGRTELPGGVRWVAAGEIESRQESFGGLGAAVLIAIFGILAILVLEFGTFRGTLVVASVIPLGVLGGLVALWLTGYTLSFTAMIGFVALIGIEIKNSILLVDFTNQLRKDGLPLVEAVQKAGEVRFLPIVLTTLTAIGGLVPLAIQGSSLYSPLAWVIIGGLVSSTVLSRLVTPVMYLLLAPKERSPEPTPSRPDATPEPSAAGPEIAAA